MGKKYEFKVDSNPKVGSYNPVDQSKPKAKGATITKKSTTYRKPAEINPDPGAYSGAYKSFAETTKSFKIG